MLSGKQTAQPIHIVVTFNCVSEAFGGGGVVGRCVKSINLQAVSHILGFWETLDHWPVDISCWVSSDWRGLGVWKVTGKAVQREKKAKNKQDHCKHGECSLTVADGSERVIVLYALADDPPLGEDRVGAQGIHVKAAPGSHQVIGADVACASTDGKVPVGQGEGRVTQHVLVVSNEKSV